MITRRTRAAISELMDAFGALCATAEAEKCDRTLARAAELMDFVRTELSATIQRDHHKGETK